MAFQEGDEVVMNYGPFSNTQLFAQYGFYLTNNIYDCALISVMDIIRVYNIPAKYTPLLEMELHSKPNYLERSYIRVYYHSICMSNRITRADEINENHQQNA